ncbi:MAG: helix-turn-helix domain-containing protein [Eubacteriales bacterium]|nr:helix-turn-helix domain-containing protein [Eubacteriales bacterium]
MHDFEQIARDMAKLPSVADMDMIVNDILEKTLSIVQADAGLLWEYDPDSNQLYCKAYRGIAQEIALSLRLALGEGLIGKTYLRGTPKLYNSMDEIRLDIGDFSAENRGAMKMLFGNEEINSAYLMPIYVNSQIECILIVYRAQGNRPFLPADIETLDVFSGLIEIALANAKGLLALQAQMGNLQKCNSLYATLTNYSVNNSGISSIVDELSGALEAPVAVINRMTNERHPKNAFEDANLLAELAQRNAKNGEAFLVEPEGRAKSYAVYPILAENSCLGYFIVNAEDTESPLKRMLLEVGRMVLAVEFSKAQSRLDISYKRMAQSFSELVSANSPAALSSKSSELGISQKANYAVLIFAFPPDECGEIQESAIYRVIADIRKELGVVQKLTFASQDRIIALLHLQTTDRVGALSRQIDGILSCMLQSEGLPLCAGLGSTYNGPGGIGRSYHEAEKALSYQLTRHNGGLMQYAQMGIHQIFVNLLSDDAESFLHSVLAPLAEKSENLEATLIAYLESGYSLKKTAQSLFIHPNTLYQRLKKIEDCLNISFDNPDDLLKLQLARYLKSYYPDASDGNRP